MTTPVRIDYWHSMPLPNASVSQAPFIVPGYLPASVGLPDDRPALKARSSGEITAANRKSPMRRPHRQVHGPASRRETVTDQEVPNSPDPTANVTAGSS